jgi:hypothetical protein
MLPASGEVQEIYKTARNFITESWSSGYSQGDCGFENLSKGLSYLSATSSDKGRGNTLTLVMIAFFDIFFSSALTQ